MNRESHHLACLIPTGSACEKINGISHLFEHMLISEVNLRCRHARMSGHTREDYVILFGTKVSPAEIMDNLRQMKFSTGELAFHKEILIKEIEKESTNDQEAFFRFVWQGNTYDKSPLGTVSEVETITPAMLEALRQETLKKPLFFYSTTTGIEIINREEVLPSALPPWHNWRRQASFRGKYYDICYFRSRIEAFHLLNQILKELNPNKHVQLTEKKDMSAWILEAGTKFPTNRSIGPLREKALQKIDSHLSEIRVNEMERALNELESIYFCGRSWQERIEALFAVSKAQLLDLAKELV